MQKITLVYTGPHSLRINVMGHPSLVFSKTGESHEFTSQSAYAPYSKAALSWKQAGVMEIHTGELPKVTQPVKQVAPKVEKVEEPKVVAVEPKVELAPATVEVKEEPKAPAAVAPTPTPKRGRQAQPQEQVK